MEAAPIKRAAPIKTVFKTAAHLGEVAENFPHGREPVLKAGVCQADLSLLLQPSRIWLPPGHPLGTASLYRIAGGARFVSSELTLTW